MNSGMELLLKKYKNFSDIAREFKVTRQAVSLWARDGIPIRRVFEAEKRTGINARLFINNNSKK